MDISERRIRVTDGTIYTKLWLPADSVTSEPVILLHDSLGCVEMWRDFPRVLAVRLHRPVLAYDRLGSGRSSARSELPSTRFVTQEAELYFPTMCRLLNIDHFIVFGHSVGGAMAVVAAARSVERCRAVITESAQAFVETQTVKAIAAAKVQFSAPQELAKLRKYHGDKAQWVVDAWTHTWLAPEFLDWSLEAELPRVTCPLLALHGENDEYGSLAFPNALSGMTAGPAEQFILQHCGHVPHREQEEPVLGAVANFLERMIDPRDGAAEA